MAPRPSLPSGQGEVRGPWTGRPWTQAGQAGPVRRPDFDPLAGPPTMPSRIRAIQARPDRSAGSRRQRRGCFARRIGPKRRYIRCPRLFDRSTSMRSYGLEIDALFLHFAETPTPESDSRPPRLQGFRSRMQRCCCSAWYGRFPHEHSRCGSTRKRRTLEPAVPNVWPATANFLEYLGVSSWISRARRSAHPKVARRIKSTASVQGAVGRSCPSRVVDFAV